VSPNPSNLEKRVIDNPWFPERGIHARGPTGNIIVRGKKREENKVRSVVLLLKGDLRSVLADVRNDFLELKYPLTEIVH